MVGFALLSEAYETINWVILGKILLIWTVSPIISAIVGGVFYLFTRSFILLNVHSYRRALIALPILYGLTTGINVFAALHHSSNVGWYTMPKLFPPIGAAAFGAVTGLMVQCVVVPLIKERIKNEKKLENSNMHAAKRLSRQSSLRSCFRTTKLSFPRLLFC